MPFGLARTIVGKRPLIKRPSHLYGQRGLLLHAIQSSIKLNSVLFI